MLGNFKLNDVKALIITAERDEKVDMSSRNIPGVKAIASSGLNVYDILNHQRVIVTQDAVAKIEEVFVYGKPSRCTDQTAGY